MRRRRLALLAGALALGGCASLVVPDIDRVSGRLSVQVAAHAGAPARGVSAGFELIGDALAGELRLSNPLGLQVAAAHWRPGEVRLVTPQGESRFADLDALSREALGEPVPLRALPDWLRGRPWPGAVSQATAGGFEQLGWAIDLSRWAEGQLLARRETAPTVTVRARLESPA